MKRLPPLGALEAFVVVARHGSLTRAGHELSLSPSALSRRIATIEAHVGHRLFQRLPRELRLTPEGHRLHDALQPAFEALSTALARTIDAAAEPIRIGVLPAFATAWLLPRMARFRAAHPRIAVELDTSAVPLARLGSDLDAAIVLAREVKGDVAATPLDRHRMFAVCAPALIAGPPGLRSIDDIRHHPLLVHRDMDEATSLWLGAVGAGATLPKRVEHYDSGTLLFEAAANGLGIALALDVLVGPYLASGRLVRPFTESIESRYNYHFVSRQSATAAPDLRHFRDWLLAEVAADARTRRLAA